MITYQVEEIYEVRAEIEPMLVAHYAEIATDKSLKPLDIDWDAYYEIQDLGRLRILTARDKPEYAMEPQTPYQGRGSLVGYFVSFIMPNLHYSSTKIAMNDIFYVDPAWRKGSIGYRLIKEAAADLKKLNCDILTIHMKVTHPFRNLLIRQGFTLTEENWDKVL